MLTKFYNWYGRKTVWAVTVFVIALIIGGVIINATSQPTDEVEEVLPVVTVASVSELSGEQSLALLGTVRAVSEAEIQSESAGRVTSVPVTLGQQVTAGQVIATLENASQRAAVLQAEGSYEAALANASAGNISVTQAETDFTSAKNSAINSMQAAYSTVSNAFYTQIDNLYRDPNSPLTYPYTWDNNRSYLSQERVAFQDILPAWQQEVSNLDADDDLTDALSDGIDYTTRTRNLVDSFISAIQGRDAETINGLSTATLLSDLTALRATLDNSITALKSSQSSLVSAADTVTQAQIGGTQTEVSTANAQVKQALGSLRAAEANLAKTIMRSPIAGTINELSVHVGDFLGSFTKVAKVANNQALEVTVFVGENDLAKIAVGTTVMIDDQYEGTVTNIGAGVDSSTQKTEVKIATETTELTNGNTVTVSISEDTAESTDQEREIVLPITAVKFSADAGSVFTVENGELVEHPVTIGAIRGGFVTISDGVSSEMEIVVDARGLTAGSQVEASK